MGERKAEFTYTYRESVRWLLDNPAETGKYPLNKDVVYEHVERMRQAGWDAHKILQKCARFDIYDPQGNLRIPLVDLVYFDHPVISELPDHEVRGALYRMAAMHAAENRADLFDARMAPVKAIISKEIHERTIRAMEQFMNRLTAEASSPVGRQNA